MCRRGRAWRGFPEALERAYAGVFDSFDGMHFRHDIGQESSEI